MTAGHWLSILVYPNLPGMWAARSLEHDIAVEGNTRDAAIDWILRLVFAHIEFDRRHGRQPLSTFPEAPQRYWHAFAEAEPYRTVKKGRDGRRDESGRGVLVALSHDRPPARGCRLAVPPPFSAPGGDDSRVTIQRPLPFN